MKWPQFILSVMLAYNVTITLVNMDITNNDSIFDSFLTILSVVFLIIILSWGGFF